jgi:hypothetical protein
MEDSVIERLSRFMDDDLAPADADEIATAVTVDAELRRELESLARVRSSLRTLADRERPPKTLDVLVGSLFSGRPDTAFVRPWARRLAAAAVIVLGLTVVFEVQRRQGGPTTSNWQERALTGGVAEPTERFTLAPLPTASAPAERRPVGAADRLLSAPDPEIEPVLEPAPALEVLGPLNDSAATAPKRGDRDGPGPGTSIIPRRGEGERTGRGENQAGAEPSAALPDKAEVESNHLPTGTAADRARSPSSEAGVATAQLFVFMAGETAWRSFEPDGPCEAGRYVLRVRIENGVVRAVWPVANPPAPTRQVRASQLVLGLEIENVVDGEYPAEVVVEPRRPPDP